MIKSFVTFGLLSLAPCILAFAGAAGEAPSSNSVVLLEIDGVKVTMADFEQKRPSGMFHARNTFYEAERKALDEYIDQYLIERQAKKENLTVDALIQKHVKSIVQNDPPEEALKVYYEGIDTTQPYEAVRDQIVSNIRDRRNAKAKSTYIQSLRSQANVNIVLAQPRAQVSLKETAVRGPKSAPVTVIEYADYECAYCQQMQPVIDKLEAEYKGRVAFAYKDVPLPMHPHAQKASEASLCAAAQNKYWEYHDVLFQTKQLELAQLKQHARDLKLNGAAFDKCLDSNEKADAVKVTFDEGQSIGLQGTPSFFINGRFFSGGLPYDQIKAVVDEEIASAAKPRAKDTAKR